jgi:hypothetical protein
MIKDGSKSCIDSSVVGLSEPQYEEIYGLSRLHGKQYDITFDVVPDKYAPIGFNSRCKFSIVFYLLIKN